MSLTEYGVESFFENSDASNFSFLERTDGDSSYLLITEYADDDSGQHLFLSESGLPYQYIGSETVIDIEDYIAGRFAVFRERTETCSASHENDHRKVHEFCVSAEGNYSSASGPDGGNLACVWAVRHLIQDALGRSVHETDLTTNFEQELNHCFPSDLAADDIPPGGIVISPTEFIIVDGKSKRVATGHVGILGEGNGDSRLIYSNSSSAADWKQNFTVGSWVRRYTEKKELPTRFYPVPLYE